MCVPLVSQVAHQRDKMTIGRIIKHLQTQFRSTHSDVEIYKVLVGPWLGSDFTFGQDGEGAIIVSNANWSTRRKQQLPAAGSEVPADLDSEHAAMRLLEDTEPMMLLICFMDRWRIELRRKRQSKPQTNTAETGARGTGEGEKEKEKEKEKASGKNIGILTYPKGTK